MVDIGIRILANIAALYAASAFVPGFVVRGGIQEFALAGVALGLLNLVVKPIIKTLTFPIILLTLGSFSLVINGALVWAVDYWFDFITIHSFMALLWATLVITLINIIAWRATKN